jgi:Ran GTPase-activating protein (RanGAP) involved in mRNA processing and transport
VNALGNSIGVEQAQELIHILQAKDKLTTLCGFNGDETELDLSNKNLRAGCAFLVANEISDMGALSVLSMKSNSLGVEGGKALAEGLKGNSVITELNIADNNLANYGRDMSGVIILADVIKDMGALSSANLLMSDIGSKQAQALANILKEHATLKSLCGNKGDETELDMGGKGMSAWDAIMLAPEIADNGALSKLDLSRNRIPVVLARELNSTCKANGIDLLLANGIDLLL